MMFKIISSILMMLALGVSGAASQSLHISLPDSAVDAGAQIDIPVTISEITTPDAVMSGEWTFSLSNNLIELVSAETAGTLLDGVTHDFNYTSGRFVFASAQPIVGEGVVMILKAKVSDDARKFQETTITLNDVRLNEGDPAVTFDDGTIKVRGIEITPREPITPLVAGDSLQFEANGTVTQPVTWSSSADSVATISPDGLLKALAPGTVRIIAEDATGLADTTAYFRIEPVNLLDLMVEVTDASVYQTLEDTVQLRVTDMSGLNILSGQFDLAYSPDQIEILSISTDGTLFEGRPAPTIFQDENRVRVVFADTQPFDGEGALLNIGFRVMREASGNSVIRPQNVQFNESFQAEMREGTISIIPAPEIVVNPVDVDVTKGFTKPFQVTSGGSAPYTWETDNEEIATIDAETGELQAHSRGITYVTATDSDNFSSEPVRVVVNDVTVSLPEADILDDSIIELPVETMDVTGLGIIAYELEVDFDSTLVSFLGVETSGTLSEGINVFHSETSGLMKVAVASVEPLEGVGDLIRLKFSATDAAVTGDVSQILLNRVQFNEPGADSPTATRESGGIRVQKTVLPGTVQLTAPANGAQNVSETPTLAWEATADANSYELVLSANSDLSDPIIQQSGLTKTSYTTGSLDYLGEYFWQVRAEGSSGSGPWSDVWSFTVKDQDALAAPTLIAPAANATDLPRDVVFEWNSVNNATTYRFLLATDANLEAFVADSALAGTQLEITGLDNSSDYYWQVTASNGTQSSSSEVRNFSTAAVQVEIPKLATPQNGASGTSTDLTLSWHRASLADSYTVELATNQTFDAGLMTLAASDTFTVVTGLAYETQYYWRVKSMNGEQESDFSAPWSFTTSQQTVVDPDLSKITLVSPINGATGLPLSLQLIWQADSATESYRVQVSPDSNFGLLIFDELLSENQTYVNLPEYGTTFYWRVRGEAGASVGAWSNVWTLSTQPELPQKVQLADPLSAVITTEETIRLSWHKSYPAVTGYQIQVADNPEFTPVIKDSVLADTSTVVGPIKSEGNYYWRVRAINEAGYGEFSEAGNVAVELSTSVDADGEAPAAFELKQNYPNPFNPSTVIEYRLQEPGRVRLAVYNIDGREVARLVDEVQSSGIHQVRFLAGNLASGLYIYRIEAGNFSQIRKMMLIK